MPQHFLPDISKWAIIAERTRIMGHPVFKGKMVIGYGWSINLGYIILPYTTAFKDIKHLTNLLSMSIQPSLSVSTSILPENMARSMLSCFVNVPIMEGLNKKRTYNFRIKLGYNKLFKYVLYISVHSDQSRTRQNIKYSKVVQALGELTSNQMERQNNL